MTTPGLKRLIVALDTTFKALISLGIIVSSVIMLFGSWSDRRALETLRAANVDRLSKTVLERDGLADKVAALEKDVNILKAGQSTEYTSRTEADTQQQKEIAALKAKLETKP